LNESEPTQLCAADATVDQQVATGDEACIGAEQVRGRHRDLLHKSLRVAPAMAADMETLLWSLEEVVEQTSS
jgi:hypothetical protein